VQAAPAHPARSSAAGEALQTPRFLKALSHEGLGSRSADGLRPRTETGPAEPGMPIGQARAAGLAMGAPAGRGRADRRTTASWSWREPAGPIPTFFISYLDFRTSRRRPEPGRGAPAIRVQQDEDGLTSSSRGRSDDLIISGRLPESGPFEVESALVSHEAVRRGRRSSARPTKRKRGAVVPRGSSWVRDGFSPGRRAGGTALQEATSRRQDGRLTSTRGSSSSCPSYRKDGEAAKIQARPQLRESGLTAGRQ